MAWGIRANLVVPGLVDTPLGREASRRNPGRTARSLPFRSAGDGYPTLMDQVVRARGGQTDHPVTCGLRPSREVLDNRTYRRKCARRVSAPSLPSVTAAGVPPPVPDGTATGAPASRRGAAEAEAEEASGLPGRRGGLSRPAVTCLRRRTGLPAGRRGGRVWPGPRRGRLGSCGRAPGRWALRGKAGTGWSGRGAGRGRASGPDHRRGSRSWASSCRIRRFLVPGLVRTSFVGMARCPPGRTGMSRRRSDQRRCFLGWDVRPYRWLERSGRVARRPPAVTIGSPSKDQPGQAA
jgi:hypothetical protein